MLRNARLGENRAPCPRCAASKARARDEALTIRIDPDGGFVWQCKRCSWTGGARGTTHEPDIIAAPPKPPPRPFLPLWHRSIPIAGTVGQKYLVGRGCALPHPEGDLRFLEHERHYPSDWCGPCMIGLITDAVTAAAMSIHRTWIAPDGSAKAAIHPPRRLWPGFPKAGGVIRLWPDWAVTTGLAIGEGIETSLAMAKGYGKDPGFGLAWATVDANNMKNFPVLPGVEALTVAVDNDPDGIRAFEAVRERWNAAGREVWSLTPKQAGLDLADLTKELVE